MIWPLKRKQQKPAASIKVKEAMVGQCVEVKFHDPTTIGFTKKNEITLTRFNADELKDRVVQGIVEEVDSWDKERGPVCGWYLRVTTFKLKDNVSTPRTYLFLEDEIEHLRPLT